MRKSRKIVITGAAIASAAALAISGTATASAHEGGKGNGEGKAGKGGALASLVEEGTISSDEATAIREAMQASHDGDKEARQAERAAAKAEILADLVADGTLTQAQADAISAAEKGGMRELIANGTIDREDVQALKSAMRDGSAADREAKQAERAAERDAVLDALVADGTLTPGTSRCRRRGDHCEACREASPKGRSAARKASRASAVCARPSAARWPAEVAHMCGLREAEHR
jgi:hypothetical protein